MIKPSETKPADWKPANHDNDLKDLESHIDACIRHADEVGQWPASIDALSTHHHIADVTMGEAAELYRAAGWIVFGLPRGSSVLMTINRPAQR